MAEGAAAPHRPGPPRRSAPPGVTAYAMLRLSGLQTAFAVKNSDDVNGEMLPRSTSISHRLTRNEFGSPRVTATDLPSGESAGSMKAPGGPTAPSSLPARSNQMSRVLERPTVLVREDAVVRHGKSRGKGRQAVPPDVLCNRRRLARELEAARVERLLHEPLPDPVQQIARRRIGRARVGSDQALRLRRADGTDVDPSMGFILGQVEVEEVAPIRQKEGEPQKLDASGHEVGELDGLPAILRDPIDLGSRIDRKENRSRRAPAPAPRYGGVAERLQASSRAVDLFQLPLREESDRAAVRRPEGEGRSRPCPRGGERRAHRGRADRGRPARSPPRDECQTLAVRRKREHSLQRHLARRRDREPHRRKGRHRRLSVTRWSKEMRGHAAQNGAHHSEHEPARDARMPGRSLPRLGRQRRRRAGRNRQRIQRKGNVPRRLKALLRALFDTMPRDPFDRGWNGTLRQPARLLLEDRRHRFSRRLPLERRAAREHLAEDRSEREDVGPLVDRRAAGLLRRHVADRADDRPGLGVAATVASAMFVSRGDGRPCLGQAEVENLDPAVLRDQDVVGLQVPMHDPLLVRRREPEGDLARDRQRRRTGSGPPRAPASVSPSSSSMTSVLDAASSRSRRAPGCADGTATRRLRLALEPRGASASAATAPAAP